MDFSKGGSSGVCPYCGSENISYGTGCIDDRGDGYVYDCCCENCNKDFKECYDLVFVGHCVYTD